jgi:hypothetical protein
MVDQTATKDYLGSFQSGTATAKLDMLLISSAKKQEVF